MIRKIDQQFSCSKMMLPEHRTNLERHCEELIREEELRRPQLDEQRREEMQRLLEQALQTGQSLKIDTMDSYSRCCYRGLPLRCDPATGQITIRTDRGKTLKLKASEIVHLEFDQQE